MGSGINAFLILVVLALVLTIGLFLLLRSSLEDLLHRVLRLPSGTTFYLRSFLLVLVLSALSAVLGTNFDMKPDSHFMEYVWKGAEGLSSTLEKMLWFVALYLVLITVLIATLKIKDDK